jgi:hypothetical protein
MQRQLDSQHLQRLRQSIVLRPQQLQLDLLHRGRPARLGRRERGQRHVLRPRPQPNDHRHIHAPPPSRVGLGELLQITSRNTSHFSSGDSCRRARRLPFSIISSSWSVARTASQDQVEKRPDLYHEVRRKPLPTTASPLYEPALATERSAKRRRNRRRPDDAAAQVASIRAAHPPGRVERGRKLVENRDRKEGGKVITERPLLTVRRGFPRPTASSVRRFADAATVHLVVAMDGRGALDHEIKAVDPASSVFAAPR